MASRIQNRNRSELRLIVVTHESSQLRSRLDGSGSAMLSVASNVREMVGLLDPEFSPSLIVLDGTHPNLLALTGIMQALRDDFSHIVVYPESVGLTQLLVPIDGANSCTMEQLTRLLSESYVPARASRTIAA